jgi:hypothetical protein
LRILYFFAAAGAFVPCVWATFSQIVRLTGWQSIAEKSLYKFQLMMWPSSIFMLGTAEGRPSSLSYWRVFGLSLAANVVVYLAVGLLIYLGLTRFMGIGVRGIGVRVMECTPRLRQRK